MIYVGDKNATPYYEDYKPVNVYRNNVKIAGWRVDEKSGASLEWADTYNDKVVSAVVPGASSQVGTPAPDAPIPITSTGEASGIDLTVTGNAGQSYQVHRDMVLRSLPDGTRDEWDAVTGTVTRNVGIKVFDGTEEQWRYFTTIGVNQFYIPISDAAYSPTEKLVLSTHYKAWYIRDRAYDYNTVYAYNGGIAFNDNRFVTTPDWVAYLAAQYAAGTPVTVLYKLATPIIETIDSIPLPTYPRYTMLNCNAEVTARVRVVEHGL